MADRAARADSTTRRGPSTPEFVALIAALMASNALAIDVILPALPAIGDALAVSEANQRQLVITAYLIGFGLAQMVYGPLADRFGRKGLLITGMVLYAAFGLLAGIATSFTLLLAARLMQGFAAAASRVIVMAVVRDRYQGSAMARIMSVTMIIFMIVPVLAPSLGQAVLAVGTWRHIFIALGIYGTALAIWVVVRLPETLPREARRALSLANIREAVGETVRSRQSIGNTVALTMLMGCLFAFINSIQQIIFDVFGRPEMIGIAFACMAAPMAFTSYANSRLVMRLGSKRILIAGLCAFTAMALTHLLLAKALGDSFWMFVLLQAGTMGLFGLIGANAGALSMEPLGHIAGTASSVQGVITTTGGALIGFAVGQQFDGTILPLLVGFTLCGAAALVSAAWANRHPARDNHDPSSVEAQESRVRPG